MVLGKVDEVVLDQRPAFHQQHRIERSHGRLTKYMLRTSGSFKCKEKRRISEAIEKIRCQMESADALSRELESVAAEVVGRGWGEATKPYRHCICQH